MNVFNPGSPERFAEELYYLYSESPNLTVDEVKKYCYTTLNILMQEGDTAKRMYYGEVKKIIKQR